MRGAAGGGLDYRFMGLGSVNGAGRKGKTHHPHGGRYSGGVYSLAHGRIKIVVGKGLIKKRGAPKSKPLQMRWPGQLGSVMERTSARWGE